MIINALNLKPNGSISYLSPINVDNHCIHLLMNPLLNNILFKLCSLFSGGVAQSFHRDGAIYDIYSDEEQQTGGSSCFQQETQRAVKTILVYYMFI